MPITIKWAAEQTTRLVNNHINHNDLKPLADLRAAGMAPHDDQIWIGLGFLPDKFNALRIDPDRLPTDDACNIVAGLDVILSFHGFATRYGILRKLCGSLYHGRPRRLLAVDLDYKRIAFLKLGGK